jgi:MFS family permease
MRFVVATALSSIRKDFGASIETLQWTVNAYNLSFAVPLLTGAALGDRIGRRLMFMVGLAVFTLGSAACALAPSASFLIGARAIQGAGGAMVMPLALALLSAALAPEKRARALGLFSGLTGLALIAGPVGGGTVVQGVDWHRIFWPNVPIGLLTIALTSRRLSESRGPTSALDIGGLLPAGALLWVRWKPTVVKRCASSAICWACLQLIRPRRHWRRSPDYNSWSSWWRASDRRVLAVDLEATGTRHELAPSLDLAAYRVVQEALTNALKYAPRAYTRLCVQFFWR